jgi:hypothetical protein
VPVITTVDLEVAEQASKLLTEWGSVLRVSATQIVRWRSVGVFDLPSGPRRGRGHLRQYPEHAADLAARFRLVVERTDSLDEALLVAMTEGLEVSHEGIADSFGHLAGNAVRRLMLAKSPKKRSQRFTFPGPHEPNGGIARDAMLGFTTGTGHSHSLQTEALIERLSGPDALQYLQENEGISRIHDALSNLALVALWRKVRESSREDLAWASNVSRSMIEYALALSSFTELTGIAGQGPMNRALAQVGKRLRQVGVSHELGLAFLAPAVLIFLPSRAERKQLSESAESCRKVLPSLRALTEVATDLPEDWRPCIGAGGLAVFARLPKNEADDLLACVREWLDTHPDATNEITIKDATTRAAELTQMPSTDEVT